MTWSRQDIIADIKRRKLDVDVSLPYWELRAEYCQARYTRAYLASGSFSFASGTKEKPPPPFAVNRS
uniref:Uncharacterized protein n=1 Tax=viral metagenome TaxID=1070528 RepID=A0A6M3LT72_9ZZZZ